MDRSTKFWDRLAANYAKQPIADEESYQKKLEITRGYFQPNTEVLEFGCGTGSTAIVHAPYVKHIRAIDFSANMLEIARNKADAANIDNITFERSTIEEFKAPGSTFDMVLGMSILQLLESKEAAIAKVYQMLKPGGVFITSTTCLGDTMQWFGLIVPIGKFLGLLPVVKIFTVQDLVDSLTAANFAIDHQWQPGKGKAVFIVAKKLE